MTNTNNSVAKVTSQQLLSEKNVTESVANQIVSLQNSGKLVLPKNYSPENALKSAFLTLSDQGLLNTDQNALAKCLLDMCIQGLNPSKNQCYFISYGGKVQLQRSYFGDMEVAKLAKLVKEISAYIIYKGDEVNVSYTDAGYLQVQHKTSFENWDNEIIGAYVMAVMPDGSKRYDLMTIARIKKSWGMSSNRNNNKLQSTYTDEACKRTVIRHFVKTLYKQSDDSNLIVSSLNETPSYEADEVSEATKINAINAEVTEVNETQAQTVKPTVNFDEQPKEEVKPQPQPQEEEAPIQNTESGQQSFDLF